MRSSGFLAALAGLIGVLALVPAADAVSPSVVSPSVVSTVVSPIVASSSVGSPNLIVNGGPSVGLCSSSGYEDMTDPGWTISAGAPNEVCLQNTGHFPDATTPGVHPGSAFFAGGTHGDGSLTQTVSVAADRQRPLRDADQRRLQPLTGGRATAARTLRGLEARRLGGLASPAQ
jgi:hypothetical protein